MTARPKHAGRLPIEPQFCDLLFKVLPGGLTARFLRAIRTRAKKNMPPHVRDTEGSGLLEGGGASWWFGH
jgi:hypothetical protein